MDPIFVTHLLSLLVIANGTPLLAGLLLRDHAAWALDGGMRLADGHPLFGPSKTVRGVVAAVTLTAACAPLLGYTVLTGALFAVLAMTGDLATSFTKRRLGYATGCTWPLLDQLPETLLPLWVLHDRLGGSLLDSAVCIALFTAIDLLATRLLKPSQAQCR